MSTQPSESGVSSPIRVKTIEFKHFRALHATAIDIDAFNLLIGANGSGKSTVLAALRDMGSAVKIKPPSPPKPTGAGSVVLTCDTPTGGGEYSIVWQGGTLSLQHGDAASLSALEHFLAGIRSYQWDAAAIITSNGGVAATETDPGPAGGNFSTALRNLKTAEPATFAAWRDEFIAWFPEYRDVIIGDTAIEIFLHSEEHPLALADLSEGTLYAMATLLISHAPAATTMVCIEEPDRAITPRLLGSLRDALYRLAFPRQFYLDRDPIQVIATTHSPYLIDLFKDCPEQIRITSKDNSGHVHIRRLSDDPDILERIGDASLGEVWFSGILDS